MCSGGDVGKYTGFYYTASMAAQVATPMLSGLLMDRFGITKLRRSMAIQLSGGEKRRLTIARALATSPKLLMLDEPFSGVDPIAVSDIQKIVMELRDTDGLSILITDHNVRETLHIVDRAYILFEGKVIKHGTSEEIANDPIARKQYLGDQFRM